MIIPFPSLRVAPTRCGSDFVATEVDIAVGSLVVNVRASRLCRSSAAIVAPPPPGLELAVERGDFIPERCSRAAAILSAVAPIAVVEEGLLSQEEAPAARCRLEPEMNGEDEAGSPFSAGLAPHAMSLG